jgi:lipoate-protein ligase A
MEALFKYKIPEGKFMSIYIKYNKIILNAKINGDFFIYPSDAIFDIEKAIVGLFIDESKEDIMKVIDKIVKEKNIEMIGINSEAIAYAIKMAVSKKNEMIS